MEKNGRLNGFYVGLNSLRKPLVRVAKGTHCMSDKVIEWSCLSPDPSLKKYDGVTFRLEGHGTNWVARDVEPAST